MANKAVVEILERGATDDRFIGQLTDNFAEAVKDYDLTSEEHAALASGDISWIEEHVGPLHNHLRTWGDCRLQQERL